MKAKSISAALALWKDRLAYSTPKANTLSFIPLSKGGPSSVAIADGKLYIAHYNVVQGQDDSALSIVDLETGAIEEHASSTKRCKWLMTEGSIYVLGDWAIYQYNAESVELIGSKPMIKCPVVIAIFRGCSLRSRARYSRFLHRVGGLRPNSGFKTGFKMDSIG